MLISVELMGPQVPSSLIMCLFHFEDSSLPVALGRKDESLRGRSAKHLVQRRVAVEKGAGDLWTFRTSLRASWPRSCGMGRTWSEKRGKGICAAAQRDAGNRPAMEKGRWLSPRVTQ